MLVLIIVIAAVVVIGAIAYGTQRKSSDGVATFRRQIDALSPQARKPVVDQVQSVSELRRSSDQRPFGSAQGAEPGATDAASGEASDDVPGDAETGDEPDERGGTSDGA